MDYIKDLKNLFSKIEIHGNKGDAITLEGAISKVVNLVIFQNRKGNKVIFIGNGGSASIASHMSTDFLKNANIRAIAFNDATLITCLSNDLGYEYVFERPMAMLSKKGDILFSISSSGKSKNILNAAKMAKKRGCFLITLSGFSRKNPLRKLGDINFYIPSGSYGYVEIIHLIICHNIVDKIMENNRANG